MKRTKRGHLKSQEKKKWLIFVESKLVQDHVGNKINIDDKYLQAFLAYLQTLSYVQVEKVTKKPSDRKEKAKAGNATEAFLDGLPSDSPLRQVVKPIRKGKVTAEDLIRESGYVRTDWEKVKEIGAAMDIPQTTEELLAQLTP